MIAIKIEQVSNMISIVELSQQNQYSDGIKIQLEFKDDTFKDMAVGVVAASKKTYELEYNHESKIAIIPGAILEDNDYIYISIYGTNADSVITSNVVPVYVNKSNKLTGENAPNVAEWQQLATQLVQQYIVTNVNPRIQALTDEATRQQKVAVEQQTIVTEQQTEATRLQLAVDTAIQSMNKKLDDGTFIPEHKWENTTLFFKHSDGTWDDGVNLAMPDGSVTTEKIANSSVTRDKLADKIMVFVSENTDGSITVDIPE